MYENLDMAWCVCGCGCSSTGITCSTGATLLPQILNASSLGSMQILASGDDVIFDLLHVTSSIYTFTAPSSSIKITEAGTYLFHYGISLLPTNAGFGIIVNGVNNPISNFGINVVMNNTNRMQIQGECVLTIAAQSTLSLRNIGVNEVTIFGTGITEISTIRAYITIQKLT